METLEAKQKNLYRFFKHSPIKEWAEHRLAIMQIP
jgi:hypothetical protein